jgi:dihydrofolate synthase/folylpolyglutamate synthase
MKTLEDWLDYIGAVHPMSIDLGLERVLSVAKRLAVVADGSRTLVVAGTNGKGSTCVFAEGLLRAQGFTVGTTLSPHLHRFNERIRVNGRCVSDETICAAFSHVDAAREDASLTYFEFAILAALWVIKQAEVDVRVLEVGLGGRLDAVNVCAPDVSVITNVGLDHQNFLGNDIESIGVEKAGVLRPGVPAVLGESKPPASVLNAADELGTPLYRLGSEFSFNDCGDGWALRAELPGRNLDYHHLPIPNVATVNAATAIVAVALLGNAPTADALSLAAGAPGLPGRLDTRVVNGQRLLFDVAHNPHGAEFVARALKTGGIRPRFAIAGFLQDKDVLGIVTALDAVVGHWLFVDTTGERGQSAAQSFSKSGLATERGTVVAELGSALERSTTGNGEPTLVLGSFDVVERAQDHVGTA